MTNRITIARALVELKSLKGRIERAGSLPMVSVVVGQEGNARPYDSTFQTITALNTALVSNFDSVLGLMKRREAVKRAIVKANAETSVDIAGKTYTLAEAIEMKTFVGSRKAFIQNLQRQLRSCVGSVTSLNAQMESRIDAQRNEQASASPEVIEANINDIRLRSTATLVSHQDFQAYINAQMTEIENFEQEVDVALNEKNASTEIEVTE